MVAALGLALVGGMLLACAMGAVSIPPLDIVRMTLNRTPFFDFETTWQSTDETIIFQIRLIRVVAGALVGAALATAGVLFQGLLRNPMADPYIIGTSAGAALGATLAAVPWPPSCSCTTWPVSGAGRPSSTCCWPGSWSARCWWR